MKKTSIIFLILFISVSLFAQKDSNYIKPIDLKLYTNFDFSSQYLYFENDTINATSRNGFMQEMNGFNFSPALVFYNKKGNSHEIEISRLSYSIVYNKEYIQVDSTGVTSNILSENTQTQFQLYLRYEYKIHLFKKKDLGKFRPTIGFSATPFVVWNKFKPLLASDIPTSSIKAGLYLSVIPRIEYSINERWYLDLNFPVAIVTANLTSTTTDDPSLPIEQRTQSTIDFYNAPLSYAVRLGIGLKI